MGNYHVKVRRRPRYIDESLCVGCMLCIDGCVFTRPSSPTPSTRGWACASRSGSPSRRPCRRCRWSIPRSACRSARGKCKQGCVEACGERNAFHFDQQERIEEYDVGAIIIATGFKAFDPSVIPYYGYGKYPNVYTSLEVERLLNAGGPTSGKLVLRDGSTPKRVAIIHCVGSRDANYHAYCSRVCCMYCHQAGPPGPREDRGRGLQLLHRHPHAGQGVRGVLQPRAGRGRAVHPRQGGRHHARGRRTAPPPRAAW